MKHWLWRSIIDFNPLETLELWFKYVFWNTWKISVPNQVKPWPSSRVFNLGRRQKITSGMALNLIPACQFVPGGLMFLVRSVLELLDGSREIRSHFPSMFLFKKNYLFFWFLFLHQAPHLVHDVRKVHRACNIRYN